MEDGAIKQTVREYLLEEFLPGESGAELQDSTPLMTNGILDSIATIKLVLFLEQRYGVQFQAHEMSPDHLGSLDEIARTVRAKSGSG